jgi:2-(1,2-epoxy-1,2-dihydrophenyl)acetyl-CoA isomerase
MTDPIELELRERVATVRLNRPDRLNALDVPGLVSLRTTLQGLATDDRVRAVLITGAGAAFCAGGDVATMHAHAQAGTLPELFHTMTGEQELVVREVMSMPKPVVAGLPGVAAGGGLSLALAADWRIASKGAFLYPAFPAIGAVPDGGLTYLLPHFLGIGLAQEFLFQNTRVPASRAKELGLIHEVVEAEALAERCWARVRELSLGPTFAYGWMKRLLLSAYSTSLEGQLALERRGAVEAARRGELAEGVSAFLARRTPDFLSERVPRPSAPSDTDRSG